MLKFFGYRIILPLLFILLLMIVSCGRSTGPDNDDNDEVSTGLPMSRVSWKHSSKPYQLSSIVARGKLLWYQPTDPISVSEIYDLEISPGTETVRTLRLIFRPDTLNQFNGTAEIPSWGGISTYYRQRIHDTVSCFEVRLKGEHGRLHFDFGMVSTDIDGNGIINTEDLNHNGSCEEEEDVGLDGLADIDEPGYDIQTNPDPNGDNWFFQSEGKCPLPPDDCNDVNWDDESIRYEWLNGTEGNRDDIVRFGKPDDEMLGNNFYTTENDYYSYSIDLYRTRFLVPGSEYNGWKTYRIPFRDQGTWDNVIGMPDNDPGNMWHVRAWVEALPDITRPDTIEIADWGFPGHINSDIIPIDTTPVIIRDYEYAQNRIFDLFYFDEIADGALVTTVYLFEETTPYVNSIIIEMFVDPDDTSSHQSENLRTVTATMVDPAYYNIYSDSALNKHYVVFHPGYRPLIGRALCAWIEVQSPDGSKDTIGDFSSEPYLTKLLYHNQPQPVYASWNLMWRNCYNMPPGYSIDDFEITVLKGLVGAEHTTNVFDYQEYNDQKMSYLRILGLDQYNTMGQQLPDGLLDDRMEIWRPELGLLIFSDREPFNSDTTFQSADGITSQELQLKTPIIYWYNNPYEQAGNSQYFIKIRWH